MTSHKIIEIYHTLYAEYGQQGWWPLVGHRGVNSNKNGNTSGYHIGNYSFPRSDMEVFEICLGALLTQNTSFTSVVKSLHNLKALDALTPKGIKTLEYEVFKNAIRPSGYFNQKAKYILGFIEFFEALSGDVPTREMLLSVVGVGEETADSILLYAYKQEEFIIDAYTKRMLYSLGLIEEKATYKEVKSYMQDAIKTCVHEKAQRIILYQEYHALIVNHAKQFYSRKPYGVGCVLQE
jgi:endonuclease-3 related protein